jgi:uncharacterized protein
MKMWQAIIMAGALSLSDFAAQAQVVSVGTTNGGAIAQIGATVASVVSEKSGLQMRPQKMSGTQQYIDAVDSGRLSFGISNIMQYYMSTVGEGPSKGKKHEHLRLVATLVPFVQGVLVAKNSGINSIADLKGKRIPSGYGSSPLFTTFWQAFLQNAGLTYNDVKQVPVASLPKSWTAFQQGQVDAVIAAAGSAAVREMNAVISGGVKYLPIKDTPFLRKSLPRTEIVTVKPSTKMDGIVASTPLHTYEVVLFAGAGVDNKTVQAVTEALDKGAADFKQGGALWADYNPNDIAKSYDLPYHAGAVAYYKKAGRLPK